MAYHGKFTGKKKDDLLTKVQDGSVVTENTLHEVTSDDTLPVSGAAVKTAINRSAGQANQSMEQLRQSIDRLGTNALFADVQSGNIFFDGYSVANNYTLAKVKAQAAIDTVEIAKMPLYIVLRSGSAFRVMEATYRYLRTETSTLTLHAEYITEGVTITRYEVQCVEASDGTWNITATHTTYTAPIAPLVMMCDADNNLTLSPDTPDATLTAIWNMQTKIYTSGGDTNTLPVIVRYFGKSTRLSCLLSFDSSVSSWRGMVYSHYNAKDIYFGLISVNVSYATDGSEKIIAGGTYEEISASQTGVASSINIIAMNAKVLAEQANERAQALEEASDYDLIARIDGGDTITFVDDDAEANNAVMERLYADYDADKTVLSRRAVTIGCSPASAKTTQTRRLIVSEYNYNMVGYFEFVAEHADGDNRQRYIIRASKAPGSSTWKMTVHSHTEMTFPVLDDNGKVKTENLQAPLLQVVLNYDPSTNVYALASETPQEVLDKMYAMQSNASLDATSTVSCIIRGADRWQCLLNYNHQNLGWEGEFAQETTTDSLLVKRIVWLKLASLSDGVVVKIIQEKRASIPTTETTNQLVSAHKEQSFTPEEQEQARKNIGVDVELDKKANSSEYYPEMAVGTADNLRGRGEATEEIFTYRPSAGATDNISEEGVATMKRIKGNTVVWNQKIMNGNFADKPNSDALPNGWIDGFYYITLRATISYPSEGGIKFVFNKGNATTQNIYTKLSSFSGIVTGHKYHISCDYSVNGVSTTSYPNYSFAIGGTIGDGCRVNLKNTNGEKRKLEVIKSFSVSSDDFAIQSVWGYIEGAELWIDNLMLIDLTKMFGAGNEPTTVEEFYERMPMGIDPYAYNEGELLSVNVESIVTNGFNQFNGEYAEVLPHNTYYLGGEYTSIGFAEEVGGTTEEIVLADDRLYTPATKGYIYASGTNININLSHSGVRDGEYEPYEERVHEIPEIAQYFPEGMRSAGSVFDEITESAVIHRVGVRAYEEGDNDNSEVMTDGVNTVYPLPEPIVTPLPTRAINLNYPVWDWGTERAVSAKPSAPFRADIVYGFNAVDTIRMNKSDIEALFKRVVALEAKVAESEEATDI